MPSRVTQAHVELASLSLAFGRRQVFQSLSCSFPRGKISVLMGGSGAGKSTLLRLTGGLIRPDSGRIRVAGEDVLSLDERGLDQMRRRLGMLFQNGALLDSKSVFENIALPLREHHRLSEDEIREAVHGRLSSVGLEDVDELLPGQLSGGMLKRAALARAIVMDPEILLCDEPFSGLDPANVTRIEGLLTRLNRELGLTVIVTSHHVNSSLRMADQLLLLVEGRTISGTPRELLRAGDPRVVDFLSEDGAHWARSLDGAPAGEVV